MVEWEGCFVDVSQTSQNITCREKINVSAHLSLLFFIVFAASVVVVFINIIIIIIIIII